MIDLEARKPGLEYIGDWRCGDNGTVRYAEHRRHTEWRVAIARGGSLCSQYGGVEVPPAVFAWLIGPIVEKAVRCAELRGAPHVCDGTCAAFGCAR